MMDSTAFKTLKRPRSPNTYLVAPEGLCEGASPDMIMQDRDVTPAALFAQIIDMIAERADWRLENSDEARGLVHFIAISPLMRFKDDIDVLVLPNDSGARMAIYSRSRVGHSDLGANRKRVQAMLKDLDKGQ